jgi:hypothetical protein
MSSSSSSQCRPRLPIRQACRSSALARRRRGNQASGTPSTRPSDNPTQRLSSSKRTFVGLTEELPPRGLDALTVCLDQLQQLSQGLAIEAVIVGYPNLWTKPELRFRASSIDVDMRRLSRAPLVRVEEDPEAADAEDDGHRPLDSRTDGEHTTTDAFGEEVVQPRLTAAERFKSNFAALTGFPPFEWQTRLFNQFEIAEIPSALDLPTGLGKTSVMAIWLIARAQGAQLPRRLVYVVDRRAVVDQATAEAEKLRGGIERSPELKTALRLGDRPLPISTLRGQFVDNREWLADPAAPAIVVGTVDMVGSRLLFSGYGVSPRMRPYYAGLLGADTLVVLDEAHLVPPFQRLLQSIAEGVETFGPKSEADHLIVPAFRLLPYRPPGCYQNERPFLSHQKTGAIRSWRSAFARARR